jgi:hypothetical protein
MANMKFDISSIVKNVKSAIDPESAIPPSEEKNPLAYRAFRLNEIMKELKEKYNSIADDFSKIETNLNEVISELQEEAKKVEVPADKKEDKAEDKKEEKKEDDKAEDKAEDKKEDEDKK